LGAWGGNCLSSCQRFRDISKSCFIALYILKEPAPPNGNYQITLDIGDEATLKNYRSSDIDVSKVIAGVSTARDTVVSRYLNAAFISNTISSIPYPFVFPQPKTEGNSLADVAAKMARASNHILYSNSAGRLVNKAINLSATAIATYRISVDEQLFDQVDSSGIETPVDQLIISGIKTSIESINYPKVTVNVVYGVIKWAVLEVSGVLTITTGEFISYQYIQKRTTVTDYGWNGAEEKVLVFVESSVLDMNYLHALTNDKGYFLKPVSETTEINRYDEKSRLIVKRTEKDQFIPVASLLTALSPSQTFSYQRVSSQDEEKTYSYSNFDVLQSIRTETQQYIALFNLQGLLSDSFYGKTAKVESWSAKTYTIQNLYKPATLRFDSAFRFNFGNNMPSLITIEGSWESGGSEMVYATDGSTKPPSTTYRKPYEPIEEQINVKLKALPFAGQSFYARSRPVEVAYLESKMQATEYGNVYLSLLYGRKQGFIFGTALSNTLLSITPLSRINILWRGIRYECISDGLSWSHTLTEMAIGMRLIVLNTALESDPPTTSYPAIIASAVIEGIASQIAIVTCEVSALDFVGGTAQQLAFASCFVQAGVLIQGTAKQIATASCTVTVLLPNMIARQIATASCTVIVPLASQKWIDLTTQKWIDLTANQWRIIN